MYDFFLSNALISVCQQFFASYFEQRSSQPKSQGFGITCFGCFWCRRALYYLSTIGPICRGVLELHDQVTPSFKHRRTARNPPQGNDWPDYLQHLQFWGWTDPQNLAGKFSFHALMIKCIMACWEDENKCTTIVWQMYLLSNLAISGIYVKFRPGNAWLPK